MAAAILAVASVASCVRSVGQEAGVVLPQLSSNAKLAVGAGIALLKQHQPQKALLAFEQVLATDPDNQVANLLAASAALEIYQGEAAVKFAEKAKHLAPDDWRVNTTLVAAYALAGRRQERDAERAVLRKLHEDPKAVDAAETNGFLLEMFPAGRYRVDAVEYFHPMGKFHEYYAFFVRDAAGKRVWQFSLQSDDLNQASWAIAHAQEAAAGKRQFSLEGDGGGLHAEYGRFSGDADYDRVRAQVAQVVEARREPFPGESSQ